MKTLIVYDSMFGNTEKVARAAAEALAPAGQASVVRPDEASPADLGSFDLLIVGTPVQGGRPTKAISGFLGRIPEDALINIHVAAFDTRISAKEKSFGLKIVVGIFGYAAGRILDVLKSKGGIPAAAPEGFIVEDREGPLRAGELERAAAWAKAILVSLSAPR